MLTRYLNGLGRSISVFITLFLFVSSTDAFSQSITTGTVSGPLCAGQSVDVPYTYTGPALVVGNQFIAELSDASGSFASPVTIGTFTSTLTNWTVDCTIPTTITQGSGYRVRVRSTNPVAVGSANSTDIQLYEIYTGAQIFAESMGTSSSTIAVSTHETNDGFDNDAFTMTGTAGTGTVSIRNHTPLSTGYTGASGAANVRFTGAGFFQIEGINTTTYSNLGLGFGIMKNNASSSGSEITVSVSADGVNYTNLSFAPLPTGGGTNNEWFYRVTEGAIPLTANLRIRFTHNGSGTTINIDDIELGDAVSPATVAVTPAGPVSACSPASVTLTATSVANANYQWYNPFPTAISGATSNSRTVTATGNYSVVASDLFGCSVRRGPVAVTVAASFTPAVSIAASSTTICAGSTVTFTATPTHGGLTPSYQWKVNGTNVGSNSPTYSTSSLTNGQVVTCVMTTSLACASPSTATSNGITMTVNPLVTPSVSVSPDTGIEICPGTTVTFTATPANGGASPVYQWKKNGNNVGSNNPVYSDNDIEDGDVVIVQMTSNATCPSPATVVSPDVIMSERETPTASISAGTTSVCSTNTTTPITITVTGSGTISGTLTGGIPFSGTAPTIVVNVSPSLTTTYSVLTLIDANCAGDPVDLTGSATVTVVPATTYFQDADEDGYGNPSVTTLSCSGAPVGYVGNNSDCDDANSDINAGADEWFNGEDDDCDGLIDEGVTGTTFYQDSDGDGYGNAAVSVVQFAQPIGYVTNSSDCNDSNSAVYPGATEQCNGYDDDCDGITDEFCGPINDEHYAGLPITVQQFGVCVPVNGTLTGAFASPEAQVSCITGEDVWYYFTAPSRGVRINCSSTANDILIELQTDAGVLVDSENIKSGTGGEILNFGNLTPGNTYYIAVRNCNSGTGIGTFTLCASRIRESSCDYGSGPYSLCQAFKAVNTGASAYTFNFTPTGGGATLSGTVSGGITTIPLQSVAGLAYSSSYNVSVNAVYQLTNGLGNNETVVVTNPATCLVNTAAHPDPDLRASDTCPNVRTPNAVVGADVWICGATAYQFELTQTAPVSGSPFIITNNAPNRFVNLFGSVTPGATYNVRIRPMFGLTPGSWGPDYQCLQIASLASGEATLPVFGLGTESDTNAPSDITAGTSLFPNPALDGHFFITGAGDGQVQVEVRDLTGRVIEVNVINREGIIEITMGSDVSAGLYLVTITRGDQRETHRLIAGR